MRRGGRSPFAARRVRQRPAVRGLLAATWRSSRCSRPRWRAQSAELARDRRSRWTRSCPRCRRAAARSSSGGCSSRSATRSTSCATSAAARHVGLTLRATTRLSDAAPPPLRAAARARRREALLGRQAEIEKLHAPRRGLAARAPRAGADHAPLPQARAAAHQPGAGRARTSSSPPTTRRRSRSSDRSRCSDQRLGTVQAVLKASGARRVLDLGCGAGRAARAPARGRLHRAHRRRRLRPGALASPSGA